MLFHCGPERAFGSPAVVLDRRGSRYDSSRNRDPERFCSVVQQVLRVVGRNVDSDTCQ